MVHFVGAGPGAPDLITQRGAALLQAADCIIYAGSLVNPALLGLAKAGCAIYNSAEMTLEQVLDVMRRMEAAGKTTVRLHTGDPCLYGAIREQMDVLDAEGVPERFMMHCFSGDADMARHCAERGYYLSFAGNVTFKNAQNLRDALAVTPRERILVETDAPFLTPIPHRGRPNAPYLIPVTMRFLADELGIELDELCAQVAANTLEVYGAF